MKAFPIVAVPCICFVAEPSCFHLRLSLSCLPLAIVLVFLQLRPAVLLLLLLLLLHGHDHDLDGGTITTAVPLFATMCKY